MGEKGERHTDEHAYSTMFGVEDLMLIVPFGKVVLLGPPVKQAEEGQPLGLRARRSSHSPKVPLLVPPNHLALLRNVVRHISQNILPILILLPALLNDGPSDNVNLMLNGEEAERLEPVLCAFVGGRLGFVLVMRWLSEGPKLLVGDDALRGRRRPSAV
jgi:hypothetical protein